MANKYAGDFIHPHLPAGWGEGWKGAIVGTVTAGITSGLASLVSPSFGDKVSEGALFQVVMSFGAPYLAGVEDKLNHKPLPKFAVPVPVVAGQPGTSPAMAGMGSHHRFNPAWESDGMAGLGSHHRYNPEWESGMSELDIAPVEVG